MPYARLATFSVNGLTKYGFVADNGIVDLSARFAKHIRRCAKSSLPTH
jgi:hypothetical protein